MQMPQVGQVPCSGLSQEVWKPGGGQNQDVSPKTIKKKQPKKIKEHKLKKAGGRSIGSTDMEQSTQTFTEGRGRLTRTR